MSDSTISDQIRDLPDVEGSGELVPAAPVRTRSRVHKWTLIIILLILLLIPLTRPFLDSYNYILQIMLAAFMWVAMTSSWNIIGGYAGYVSLGHNVFFAIGGYFSGTLLLFLGISPFITAPVAGLLAMLVGLLIGLVSLRTRGPTFIISTIALLLLVRISFDNWNLIGGANGLSLPFIPYPPDLIKVPFYYGMLLAAVGAIILSFKVRHSKFGLGLRAISQDEAKAEVAGINTQLYKILAFAISAFFVGVVGSLWGYLLTYLRPTIFLGISVAADIVLMSILGGRGTVAGPVIGALLLVGINELSVSQLGFTELNIAISGFVLLVALLIFPEGIIGTLRARGKLPGILDWD